MSLLPQVEMCTSCGCDLDTATEPHVRGTFEDEGEELELLVHADCEQPLVIPSWRDQSVMCPVKWEQEQPGGESEP